MLVALYLFCHWVLSKLNCREILAIFLLISFNIFLHFHFHFQSSILIDQATMLAPLLLAVGLLPLPIHATVEFFISNLEDRCDRNGITQDCPNNVGRGNLCAYDESVGTTWCCPAEDRSCWTLGQTCQGGNGLSPGRDQVACIPNGPQGPVWCCRREVETCVQRPGQINVCVTTFRNPNADISIGEANAIAASSTGGSPTSPRSSTTSLSSSSSSDSTSSQSLMNPAAASSSSSDSTSSRSVTTPAAASSPSQRAPSGTPGAQGSGFSGAAIAGVAIGAVASLALVSAASCWVTRRRYAGIARSTEGSDDARGLRREMTAVEVSPADSFRAELGTAQPPVEVEARSIR